MGASSPRRVPFLILLILIAAPASGIAGAAQASTDDPARCRNGGFASLSPVPDGEAFPNVGACIKHVRQGGTLYPAGTAGGQPEFAWLFEELGFECRVSFRVTGLEPDVYTGEIWIRDMLVWQDRFQIGSDGRYTSPEVVSVPGIEVSASFVVTDFQTPIFDRGDAVTRACSPQ